MSKKGEKPPVFEDGVARFVSGSQLIAEMHQLDFDATAFETGLGKAGPAVRRGAAKTLQQAVALFEKEAEAIAHAPELCRSGKKILENLRSFMGGKKPLTKEAFSNLRTTGAAVLKDLTVLASKFGSLFGSIEGGTVALQKLEPYHCWQTITKELRGTLRDAQVFRQTSLRTTTGRSKLNEEDPNDDASSSGLSNLDTGDGGSEPGSKISRAEIAAAVEKVLGERQGQDNNGTQETIKAAVAAALAEFEKKRSSEASQVAAAAAGPATVREEPGPSGVSSEAGRAIKKAKGEKCGPPEKWILWKQVVNEANLTTIGLILLATKPFVPLLGFCNNEMDLFRRLRHFLVLLHAPFATLEDASEVVQILRKKRWEAISDCCLLTERFKTMCRHYSDEMDEIVGMYGDGVWPQHTLDSTTDAWRVYMVWLEMVAIYLVGTTVPGSYLRLSVYAYLAMGCRSVEALLNRMERTALKPFKESIITQCMTQDREKADHGKYTIGVDPSEMAGEDLCANKTLVEEKGHGSMLIRIQRVPVAYDKRQERVQAMKGLLTFNPAAVLCNATLESSRPSLFEMDAQQTASVIAGSLRSASQVSGPSYLGGRGQGGQARGGRGRGQGHYRGGGSSVVSQATIPLPIPANASSTDPYSGRMAPFLPPGASNHELVGGTHDVRHRCWKCGRLGHGFDQCQKPHRFFKADEPHLVVQAMALGQLACP